MLRLEFLLSLLVIVNEGETGAPASTELGVEPEADDAVLLGLELFRQHFRQLGLWYIRSVGVEDFQDELPALQHPVVEVFARAESDHRVRLG